MNNCRPGIEPAITGPRGGGQRHRLASWSPSSRGGRWRLPVPPYAGLARWLVAVGALALPVIAPQSWAVTKIDYDVMYLLVGVSPNPPDPARRQLTYRAEQLTAAQKDFLLYRPGLLHVWQKYSNKPGGAPTNVWFTDPFVNERTVTSWNRDISGSSHPAPGEIVTKVSHWTYEAAGRYGIESCLGTAAEDHVLVSNLSVMPGTTCHLTPPSNVSCNLHVTDVIDLGSLAPGQTGGGNGMITAVCQGNWQVYLTLGPVYLSNDDSNLQGLLGDRDCHDLKPTETLPVPVGSSASRCLHVEGSFATPGAKRIPGVVIASFK